MTIDDQDVSDLKFESFRKHIAVIPQNGALFNDSILFNLQYGNSDATLEEIQEVAADRRRANRGGGVHAGRGSGGHWVLA